MNNLTENLVALSKKSLQLRESILYATDEASVYEVEISRNGFPTCKVDNLYIHSRFDPVKEAERFLDRELNSEAGVIIMGGFGFGYHLESLLAQSESTVIIAVEPDINLFRLALTHRKLTDLLNSDRIYFLVGGEPEDCIVLLEQFPGKLVQFIQLRSLFTLHEDFYIKLEKSVRNFISRREVNLSTLKRFGKLWIRNLSRNAGLLAEAPGVNRLKDIFRGIPALMIAAGPSFDLVRPHLKELRKRFLLVAVDTALRSCLGEGIEPDFTVVADPQYWNTRHLDHCCNDKTILLSDTSTYPSVFRILKGKCILFSSSFPLGIFLENKTDVKGKLKAGGSVATAAWDFCRKIGADSIWCAGLDLGFPGKQTHCRGSFFEQRAHWLSSRITPAETLSWHALIDAGIQKTESNDNCLTWTDNRMKLYIRWFEEQMANFPEVRTVNLSSGGVKITGMPHIPLSEALLLDDIREEIDRRIDSIKLFECLPSGKNQLEQAINELLIQFVAIEKLTERGYTLTEELNDKMKNNEDISQTLEDLSATDSEIAALSSRDIAGFILQNYISELLKESDMLDKTRIIENSLRFYSELKDSVSFHKDILETSRDHLKKSQV